MNQGGKRAVIGIILGVVLDGLVFSCQPPQPASGPVPGGAAGEAVKPAGVRPPNPLIKVTVSGEQDPDNPALIHVSAIPFLDPKVKAQYADDTLIIELELPSGLSLEEGLIRKRSFVRFADEVQLDSVIRVINVGNLKIVAKAIIRSREGEELSYGEGELIVKSQEGGVVDFVFQQKTPALPPIEVKSGQPAGSP